MSTQPRTHDVAVTEARVWRQGVEAADAIVTALLGVRRILLEAGFPAAHVLCEDIDKDAGRWAGHRDQMRRDYLRHCEENGLDP